MTADHITQDYTNDDQDHLERSHAESRAQAAERSLWEIRHAMVKSLDDVHVLTITYFNKAQSPFAYVLINGSGYTVSINNNL